VGLFKIKFSKFDQKYEKNINIKSCNMKIDRAEDISDFRPISLIHAIAKIIAKMMATCLAPLINELVSNAQSAFLKKRSIHENFLYARI
jgi:hypothetical protein